MNKQELKQVMDEAICNYIAACTSVNVADVDFSGINEELDATIEMLGGTPASE